MSDLGGKSILIFGCATGIGAGVARRLARDGAILSLADIKTDAVEELAAELRDVGYDVIATGCDVSDEASVNAAVAAVMAERGRLDGAFMNAAAMHLLSNDVDVLSVDMATFDGLMAVNLRGPFLCTRAVLPHMIEAGRGALIYTSSDAAFDDDEVRPSYAMTKRGLNALVHHVAKRWGKSGISANAIAPGAIVTNTIEPGSVAEHYYHAFLAQTRAPRLGTPADIAAMVSLLLSDEGAWINGQIISVNGGRVLR